MWGTIFFPASSLTIIAGVFALGSFVLSFLVSATHPYMRSMRMGLENGRAQAKSSGGNNVCSNQILKVEVCTRMKTSISWRTDEMSSLWSSH